MMVQGLYMSDLSDDGTASQSDIQSLTVPSGKLKRRKTTLPMFTNRKITTLTAIIRSSVLSDENVFRVEVIIVSTLMSGYSYSKFVSKYIRITFHQDEQSVQHYR